jgi:predicted MFS family arabinose efflux permease
LARRAARLWSAQDDLQSVRSLEPAGPCSKLDLPRGLVPVADSICRFNPLFGHFVTFCGDFGVSPIFSASMLAGIGVFDLIGTIGSGWLSDRFDNRWLLAWYYGFRGLSLIWLPYSGFSLLGLSMFAMLFGLDFVATVPPSLRLTAQEFGRERAPIVFGWCFAAHQLGAGAMAFAAGLSRDALATYIPAFLVAGALCIVAAMSFYLLRNRPGQAALATAAG